jgi:uncharacterized membrane protein YjjB (DUF3815 family)
MTFGAMVGLTLIAFDPSEPPATETTAVAHWWLIPALAVVAVGSTIRFRATWRDLPVAFLGSGIALVGAELGKHWLGAFLGPFVAAFFLGAAANVFANSVGRPAQLLSVPGLALLVPGSFGVRTMSALLSDQTTLGVETAFYMFVTAMALVGGLLFSNAIFRQRSAW